MLDITHPPRNIYHRGLPLGDPQLTRKDSNWSRVDKMASAMYAALGAKLLDRAIMIAEFCLREGIFFCIEHPSTASSWGRSNLKQLTTKPGVETTVFDQCMFGLVSKLTKTPTLKRTRF